MKLDPSSQPTYKRFGPYNNFGSDPGDGSQKTVVNPDYAAPKPRSTASNEPPPDRISVHPYSGEQKVTILPAKVESPQERMHVLDLEKEDAAENFPNVLQAYLARHGTHGHWSLEGSEKKARELEFLSIDPKSLTKGGPHRFSGCATFQDGEGRVLAEVTADFSDPTWKVISIKPRSPKGPCAAD